MTVSRTAKVLLLGGLAQVILLVAVAYPPVQDYPNHLLRIHASRNLEDVPVYSRHLVLDRNFRPNSLGDWVVGGLARVLPLEVAGKIGLCLAIGLTCLAIWYYLGTFGGGVLAALIGLHLAGAWLFHKGFLNNHVAVSLGLIYLALLWPRSGILDWKRLTAAFGASLAVVAAHAFVYVSVILIATAAAVIQPGESWRRRLWRISPAVPGILLGIIFAIQQARSGLLANRPIYRSSFMNLALWNPLIVFDRFELGWDRRVGLVCLTPLAIAFLVCMLRRRAGDLSSGTRIVMLFTIIGAGLYLLVPDALSGGWVHGRLRLLHLLILIALPILAVFPAAVRRVLASIMALSLAVTVFFTAMEYRRFQAGAAEFVSLSKSLPRDQLLLTLNLVSPLEDLIRPRLHLWSYLCIEKDCLSPFLFANPYSNNLYFKRMPEWPHEGDLEPTDWGLIVELLDRESYDGVLLHGRSGQGEAEFGQTIPQVARNEEGVIFLKTPRPESETGN